MKANNAGSAHAVQPPLERFIGVAPGVLGIALSIVFVLVVGLVDHVTGPGVSLAPFYVMPVVLGTWIGGRVWGLTIAGMGAAAARLADPPDVTSFLIHTWNAVVWFIVLAAIVWLVDALNATMRNQRSRLAHDVFSRLW